MNTLTSILDSEADARSIAWGAFLLRLSLGTMWISHALLKIFVFTLPGAAKFFDSVGLPGDYNHNGVVDAADYVVWRNTLGQTVTTGTGADGNGNGVIDSNDYAFWRGHFGMTAGSGSSAATSAAVPEPATLVMLIVGIVLMCSSQRAIAS